MKPTVRLALLAVLAAALFAGCTTRPGASSRDFVFFVSSDPHVGSELSKATPPVSLEENVEKVRGTLTNMVGLIGQPYPPLASLTGGPFDRIAVPRGVLVAGDLTDHDAWPLFESVFPPNGIQKPPIPLFLCVGNHDGGSDSRTRRGVVEGNRQHWTKGRLQAISTNGLHYAWVWAGVHFVCVNLCPADSTDNQTPFNYGRPGSGSWNDPAGALTFLTGYLGKHVGKSGAPVIVWQHYGYCEGFNFDWNWWSARQRRAFYDSVKDYNVVALLHGHTHAPAHYRWPDPGSGRQELQRLFQDAPPSDLRCFDVFSAGSFGGGTFYVFRIVGDKLYALHHDRHGWSSNPALHVAIPLNRPGERQP